MTEGWLSGLTMAATVVINLGLALMVGGLASQQWLRGRSSDWRGNVLVQARTARKLGFAVGLLGILAILWLEAATMAQTALWQAGLAVASLLTHTHFGRAWLIGLIAWCVAAVSSLRAGDGDLDRVDFAVALVGLAAFVMTRSVVSHAAGGGDWTLDVGVDWLHLTLVSLWIGIVFAGARLRLPDDSASAQARGDATQWVTSMSKAATVALVAIVATGLFKAWRALAPAGSLREIIGSTYGQALSAKLALVAFAIALGGFNRLVVLPRLFQQLEGVDGRGAWRNRLVAILRFEAAMLTLVLSAAAVLSGSEPPGIT